MNEGAPASQGLWADLWAEGIESVEDQWGNVVIIDLLSDLGEPSPPCPNDPANDPELERSDRAWR